MSIPSPSGRSDSKTRAPRTSNFAICPLCDKLVELFNYARSAELFHTDVQDIEHLAQVGSVHRIHNRKGEVMICGISLFGCFDNRRTRLLDSHFVSETEQSSSSQNP